MRRVHLVRAGATVGLGVGLLAAPVVLPAWADPHPVSPTVTSTPISGVDATALQASPPAFDPKSLLASGANAPATSARASASARPATLTREIDRRFGAASLSWQRAGAPVGIVVQIRVKENGTWSEWYHLDDEGGPDPQSVEGRRSAGKAGTEPLAAAFGEALQVRVDTASGATPAGLTMHTVDPGTSPADANLAGTPVGSAHANTVRPGIVTRAQWGADESLRPADCSPEYSTTIKAGFVHHTVNTNTYGPADSARLVRAIYALHVNGNGWCDVGYQFLVDRFGVIFEGRFGGMDRPVVGAHAGGFNTDTFGVSAIGDFTSATPPNVMLDSITTVLGWKLGLHARDPQERTTLISAGGPYTNYPAGTPVSVRVVSGHRDVDATGCPGDALYPRLPTLAHGAAVYLLTNRLPDQDLYGTLATGTGSGRVEVHAQGLGSAYQQRILDAATALTQRNPGQWRFMVGSYSGDTRPDLIAVQTTGTASGRVEVRVLTWGSYYAEQVVSTVTPISTFTPDQAWQLSVGGASGGDLYFVILSGTASRTVEVHALSRLSDYADFSVHSTSAMPAGVSGAEYRFMVAKYSGDLYFVAHGPTWSGRTEIHVLTAASGYRTFSRHAVTPLGRTADATASWALGSDAEPGVFFLPLSGTGSGKVEVHQLAPGSNYGTWTLHATTDLPAVSYPGWQFSLG